MVEVLMSYSFFAGEGTPHSMHEFENKGVAKWVARKCLRREGIGMWGVSSKMGMGARKNGDV